MVDAVPIGSQVVDEEVKFEVESWELGDALLVHGPLFIIGAHVIW